MGPAPASQAPFHVLRGGHNLAGNHGYLNRPEPANRPIEDLGTWEQAGSDRKNGNLWNINLDSIRAKR